MATMAAALSSKKLMASLLLSFLLLLVAEAVVMDFGHGAAPTPSSPTLDCGLACDARCKLSSRPRLCKRACGSCCGKCHCVPPGTAGNLEACPCYANLTTHNQTRKCP